MSTNGIFKRRKKDCALPYHPEKNPKFNFPVSAENLKKLFSDCADFILRPVWPGMEPRGGVSVCWIDGLVSAVDVSETVIRPLTERLHPFPASAEACIELLLGGGVWCCNARRCESMDALAEALTAGCCAVVFDRAGAAVAFEVRSSSTRTVSTPTVEKTVKGGKDAFVETLRTNTALVRRRLRNPALKTLMTTVGRKSDTTINIMYIDGVANPDTLALLRQRLDEIDIDGLTAAGNLEQYIVDRPNSPFPQLIHTERPDKFSAELLAGRIGILVDGLPLGFLLPATLAHFMKVAEDRAQHFIVASALSLLRWLSFVISAVFPALLVAVCMYHQEMVPHKLLLSIIEAKQRVPFSVAFEVLTMLLAFELLMEAGMRLPDPAGDTVSIIGALVVGQSAVDARVVSPISVIVVATTAICGFTLPSRDLGAAVRSVRFLLVLLAIVLGLFGIAVGLALLIWYLCSMDCFGVAYTSPLCDGGWHENLKAFLRPSLTKTKLREHALHTPDRRNQR
ncbi:MAG: spore germination protein [Ruminococcaceae bacterium]|nr:spore germination protein [Oscillospiraceae bacterium]